MARLREDSLNPHPQEAMSTLIDYLRHPLIQTVAAIWIGCSILCIGLLWLMSKPARR